MHCSGMGHSSVSRQEGLGETGSTGDGFRHQLEMRSGESGIVELLQRRERPLDADIDPLLLLQTSNTGPS